MSRLLPAQILVAICLAALAMATMAENSTRIPGYTIHHNALTTDILDPAVARNYDIQRSKNRGMLNVSVIKDVSGGSGEAVAADIEAKAVNLLGQSREIELREIREGEAIYYIADFLVANRETLTFNLQVTPQGEARSYPVRLTQQFFTD